MKKFISLSLVLIMVISLAAVGLAGCSKASTGTTPTTAPAATAAPGAAATEAPKEFAFDTGDPDTLDVVQQYDPGTFQICVTDDQYFNRINRQIYETLFMMTPQGEVLPWLASEYTWETPTRLVCKLRDDVKFSDGNPFTADDVAWTIAFYKENAAANDLNIFVDTVDVIDAHTVALNLKKASATFPQSLCSSKCVIGSKKAFEDGKGDWRGASVIGTGPYKLVEYVSGDMIKFTANENYWREGEPKVKNISMRIIKNPESATTEAKTLKYDIVLGGSTRDFDAVDAVDGIHMEYQLAAMTVYLLTNTTKAPLDNVKVREAIARAIDVKNSVKLAFGNFGSPATALLCPDILGRNEETYKKYFGEGSDVTTAKALLAEAGYANGVEVEIRVDVNDTQRCDMAEAMQAQLAEAGITLTVNKMETVALNEGLNRGDHQLCLYGITARTLEADGFLTPLQPGTPTFKLIGFENQAFVDKYNEGIANTDRDARGKIWEECCEMMMQNYCLIPIWHKALGAAVRDNVDGFYFARDFEQVYYQFFTK